MMKCAVITGCDSGIGEGLCRRFLEDGYRVIISYLKDNPFPDTAVTAQKMDIRNEDEIKSFSRFVAEQGEEGQSIDYFINNAGIALGGPFENIPLDIYREIFEVNFFGLVSLTQKIIPLLIKSRGRLVVIGSMAGRVALPFLSPYVSTKFALEGFCDSVRRELNPFGIRTILIEPGGIATPIWNKAREQDQSFIQEKYRTSMEYFTENFIEGGNRGMKTDDAVEKMYRYMIRKRPAARYIVASGRFVSYLETLIPAWILDRLVIKLFHMDYGSKNDV